ncbi:hypothetical protein [Aureimonas sp. SK2]|uniref:hypothetical protein n=1 Tax=Aureimonas sp. SK2 TaxID=3015992 RepID=UPI0024451705|nr:hypothetical protein [Aureimonas sp. SK2]
MPIFTIPLLVALAGGVLGSYLAVNGAPKFAHAPVEDFGGVAGDVALTKPAEVDLSFDLAGRP